MTGFYWYDEINDIAITTKGIKDVKVFDIALADKYGIVSVVPEEIQVSVRAGEYGGFSIRIKGSLADALTLFWDAYEFHKEAKP